MSDPLKFLEGDASQVEETSTPVEAEIPAEAPAAPAPPEPGHVPISAMLDEREKRQALERRLAAIEAREAETQAKADPPPPETRMEEALHQHNLRASRRFAEREYGKAAIDEVHQWALARCEADPVFNQRMRASDDPYEAAYQAFHLEQIATRVTPDRLAAFEAWEAAQAAAQGSTTPSTAPAAPPRSLATAPGNGGAARPHIVVEEGAAFRSAIPG